MSAPLVVNTTDGTCWTRRHVTRDGLALYAPEGVCQCPEFVMATLPELAEHGIVRVADVLPVPVGPEPQALSDERLAEIRNRRLDEVTPGPWLVADGEDGKPVVYVELPAGGVRVLFRGTAPEADVQFVASARRSVPELLADNDRLRARVAALLEERHSTNEALSDAAEQLRVDRDRIAALEAEVAEGERPADEDPIAYVLTEKAEEPADKLTRLISPVQALREDDGYESPLHHDYLVGHDLPETGGDGS